MPPRGTVAGPESHAARVGARSLLSNGVASASLDLVSKALLDGAAPELVAWLTGLRPLRVEFAREELVETDVRVADRLVRAVLPGAGGAPRYFHIELQTAGDPMMGLRMLLYWARVRRGLSRAERRTASISSFVIYLDRRQYRPDPGVFRADDGSGTACLFRYSVIKLWEIEPAAVFRAPGPGLAPLAPLLRVTDPVRAVVESKRRILAAGPRSLSRRRKADLCGALFVFAGMVIEDLDLLRRLIWEDWMGLERSVTVQWLLEKGRGEGLEKGIAKGIEKGIVKGIVKGALEARREDVLSILESRFGAVPLEIRRRILALGDEELLRELVAASARVSDLRALRALLPSAPRRGRKTSR